MNPLGLLIIGLGLIMLIIGVKGTQHEVISSLGSAKTAENQAAGTASTAPSAGTIS